MSGASVEAGSALAAQIQSAVQPKLMENGWVAEENDTTLSEYVTMMIVNGKDLQSVRSELGGDLLGVGEDDAAVGEFAQWLFEHVNSIVAPQQAPAQEQQQQQAQPAQASQDAQMEDSTAVPEAAPTGPKSMRNGSGAQRGGRGGRMLGQLNRNMDRSNDLPDNLRKIRGAASGQTGRINAHAGRDGAPRGPRGGSNAANGIQRAMNGGRGGHNNNMNAMGGMGMGMGNGQMSQQQQMQLMQMMEMQANMLAQVMQNGGQMSPMGRGGFQQRGRGRGNTRGGRGGSQQGSHELHAVDGKMPLGALSDSKPANADGMEIDGEESANSKFSVMCKFNHHCTNPGCGFAHSTPASTSPIAVDLTQTCTFGAGCKNFKCHGRHPSPAQAHGGGGGPGGATSKVVCKFYPNCTNPNCIFEHPAGAACRNGADCTVPNCKFTHTTIVCKYNPCSRPTCPFKHVEGQKRGNFQDKVWTADGANGAANGKADRFADFNKQSEGAAEELILPGQDVKQEEANGNGIKQEQQGESIVT